MAEVARSHHYYETSLISVAMNVFDSLIVLLIGLHSDTGNCTAIYDCLFFSIWPQYVKDRIRSTYMYFAGSVGLTALSAVAVSRSPALMSLMTKGSWLVSLCYKNKNTFSEKTSNVMVRVLKKKK